MEAEIEKLRASPAALRVGLTCQPIGRDGNCQVAHRLVAPLFPPLNCASLPHQYKAGGNHLATLALSASLLLQVLQLQHQLLELQSKEVAALEQQVAGLAGVSDRLAALKAKRAQLEKAEEEAERLEAEIEARKAEQVFKTKQAAEAEAEQVGAANT